MPEMNTNVCVVKPYPFDETIILTQTLINENGYYEEYWLTEDNDLIATGVEYLPF